MPKFTFIDLFAGIGGFHYGMQRNGFECVYASEWDVHARECYTTNFTKTDPGMFPHHFAGDITQIDETTIPDHDVLCAGFPCQAFSLAGFRKGFEDTRGTLFFDVARIVKHKKPKIVLLENVKNFAAHDKGNTLKVVEKTLTDLGYTFTWRLINAKDHGVAQSRERVIMVATREDIPAYDWGAVPTRTPVLLKNMMGGDEGRFIPDQNDFTFLNTDQVKTQPSGLIFVGYGKRTLRKGAKPSEKHLSRSHRQQNRMYSVEGVHPTLSAQETSGRYWVGRVNPSLPLGTRMVNEVVQLTVEECYRLQGFPDTHTRTGSATQQYRQIGNAVCV